MLKRTLLVLFALALPTALGAFGHPEAIDAEGDATAPSRLDLRSIQIRPQGADHFAVVVGVSGLKPFDAPGAFADGTTYQAWRVFFTVEGHDFLLDIGQDTDGDAFAQLDVRDVDRGYGDHPRSDHATYRFDDVPVTLELNETADKINVVIPREWMLTRPAPGVAGESISIAAGSRFTAIRAEAQHGQGSIEPSTIGVTANCGSCTPVDFATAIHAYTMDSVESNPWIYALQGDVTTIVNPTSIDQVAVVHNGDGNESLIVPAGSSIEVPTAAVGAARPTQFVGDLGQLVGTTSIAQTPVLYLVGDGATSAGDSGIGHLAVEKPEVTDAVRLSASVSGTTPLGHWQSAPMLAPANLDSISLEVPLAWSDVENGRLVLSIGQATKAFPVPPSGDETVLLQQPVAGLLSAGDVLDIALALEGDSGTVEMPVYDDELPTLRPTFTTDVHLLAGDTGQALIPMPLLETLGQLEAGPSNLVEAGGLHLMVAGEGPLSLNAPDWSASIELPVVRDAPSDGPGLDIVAPDVAIPTDRLPAGGTMRYYADLYQQGVAHTEAYDAEWQRHEILGTADMEFLAAQGRQSYIAGTVPATAATATWGDTIVVHNPLAKAIEIGDDVVVGDVTAHAPDILLPASTPDDFSDGLLDVVRSDTIGGIETTHSTTVLEGTMHADDRWHLLGAPGEPLALELKTSLPPAGWIAFEHLGAITVLPATDADGFTTDSGWFAAFDHDGVEVAGLVVAGDHDTSTISLQDGFEIVTQYDAVEDLLAARYLLEYDVADLDATRYAGVLDLHDQDRNELGVIYANGDKSAGVGWAGSRADITASADLQGWWGNLWGKGDTWDIQIDAHSSQGGKHLRIIAPADVLDASAYAFSLDGDPIDTVEVLSDGTTAVITLEIDHFSLRTVQMQEVVPGVNPALAASGFVLFGLVAAYESAVLTKRRLRSRATRRGLEGPSYDGVALRSRSARAGLGAARPPREGESTRCRACHALQPASAGTCSNCNSTRDGTTEVHA